MVRLLPCAAAPAAPVFPAVVSLAGRGAGTPAQLRSGHSRWHAGTATAGTVGWHVLLGAVLEVGFCSWLRHQLSAWEICIHLLPALSLRAAPPAVKQGSQLSDAILRLNPVSEAATQRAARFGGHQVSHFEIRPLHGISALHALQDIYLIPEAAAPFLSN